MSEKRLPVITINRQYAAYGRTMAAMLSERLGLMYYDKDFVRKTVAESGFDYEEVEKRGDDMTSGNKFLNDLMNATVGTYPDYHRKLYVAEREVIKELAQEPCIIVGRCANHVLREEKVPVFSIFLYSDVYKRVKRAFELNENGNEDIIRYIRKRDTMRNNFYKTFTGSDMTDCSNYNLCLDTGVIPLDECADIICGILEKL